MFSKTDLEQLKESPYTMIQSNHHDVTIHSDTTGHDWIVISYYDRPNCCILHRHSARDPYHRQEGQYKSLKEALDYIGRHEKWFIQHKK